MRDPLLRGDIEGARKAVSMIVGRDTDRLDAEGIAKAAVETVAENTSDGVTAPLFYMILLGGIGGIFYKAVNTMDSMTGYKNPRYRYFGTAAARLDDVMNFIPARLTALFMILASYLPGKESVSITSTNEDSVKTGEPEKTAVGMEKTPAERRKPDGTMNRSDMLEKVLIPDGKAAFRVWKRDRLKSPSPNSAQTESVCAGALHLKLLGDTWYFGELHHKQEIGVIGLMHGLNLETGACHRYVTGRYSRPLHHKLETGVHTSPPTQGLYARYFRGTGLRD